MDLVLHRAGTAARQPPQLRGRLSTVGHGTVFRAFARAAKRSGIHFMLIGGTFRDVAVRAGSTRDIDIVLVDQDGLDRAWMSEVGFLPVQGIPHTWRYFVRGRPIDIEVTAVASSRDPRDPFSVAYQQADSMIIEGRRVEVPRIEDYVILKLCAAAADRRRRARDLADVQDALEAYPHLVKRSLSLAAIEARLREIYAMPPKRLKELIALLKRVPRPRG